MLSLAPELTWQEHQPIINEQLHSYHKNKNKIHFPSYQFIFRFLSMDISISTDSV